MGPSCNPYKGTRSCLGPYLLLSRVQFLLGFLLHILLFFHLSAVLSVFFRLSNFFTFIMGCLAFLHMPGEPALHLVRFQLVFDRSSQLFHLHDFILNAVTTRFLLQISSDSFHIRNISNPSACRSMCVELII